MTAQHLFDAIFDASVAVMILALVTGLGLSLTLQQILAPLRRVKVLVATVIEADDTVDLAENDYLCALATALGLPDSALDGLTVDMEIEEVQETFDAVRKGPPPLPAR